MYSRFLIPSMIFMMKYFFDIEKEITQQLLLSLHLRFHEVKELILMMHK